MVSFTVELIIGGHRSIVCWVIYCYLNCLQTKDVDKWRLHGLSNGEIVRFEKQYNVTQCN